MIIHPLPPTHAHGEICISARVETEKPPHDLPPILWFKFHESYAPFLADRADGLALSLLLVALNRGEDIRLRATLSPQLAFSMREYERIETIRNPARYHPIEIHCDGYASDETRGDNVAAAFSGGVDSFYTLWNHIPQNEKYVGNALTHAVFVKGFDIGLHDHRNFETCSNAYRAILRDLNVELLTPCTNVRTFDKHDSWNSNYKPALIGLMHLMRRGFRLFYTPAEYSYADSDKGTAMALQFGLLSNENLSILNDGAGASKFERILAVADIPATYNTLRVCYVKPDGLMNCGECGKCVNTMLSLEIAGALKNYTTFSRPLTRQAIRSAHASYAALPLYLGTIRGARARGRNDLALDMALMLLHNSVRWGGKWLRGGAPSK